MKLNMNRRGFLKVTGAAGAAAVTTAVAPTALADVKTHIRSFDFFECVDLNDPNGSPKVQYFNRHSEKFEAFYENRPDNCRIKSLTREDMADNLGEHVVEILEADPENYIISSSPGNPLAFVWENYRPAGFPTANNGIVTKITFKENHKVWGLRW